MRRFTVAPERVVPMLFCVVGKHWVAATDQEVISAYGPGLKPRVWHCPEHRQDGEQGGSTGVPEERPVSTLRGKRLQRIKRDSRPRRGRPRVPEAQKRAKARERTRARRLKSRLATREEAR